MPIQPRLVARLRDRHTAWLCVGALLFNIWLSAAATALPLPSSNGLPSWLSTLYCQTLTSDRDQSAPEPGLPSSSHPLQHCILCLSTPVGLAILPKLSLALGVLHAAAPAAVLPPPLAVPTRFWLPHSPRAPPV